MTSGGKRSVEKVMSGVGLNIDKAAGAAYLAAKDYAQEERDRQELRRAAVEYLEELYGKYGKRRYQTRTSDPLNKGRFIIENIEFVGMQNGMPVVIHDGEQEPVFMNPIALANSIVVGKPKK